MSRSRKLTAGSILGVISLVLRTIISLYMTPFMIYHFGDKLYGLWMLVASFSGFHGLFDFGLSTAAQRFLSRSLGRGDKEEANRVFNTSLVMFTVLGLLSLLLTAVLVVFAPAFVKTAEDVTLFRYVIVLFGISLAIGFPMRSFWGIFSAHLEYKVSICLDMINVIVKTVLIVIALKAGHSLITVALINLGTDLLWYGANAAYAYKVADYIKLSFKYFDRSQVREFFDYSVYAFISSLAYQATNNVDNYVISAFVGLNAVTIYSIGYRLIFYVKEFVKKALGLVTPVFSQFEGAGDYEAIRRNLFFISKISICFSIFLISILVSFGKPFIQWWVGDGYGESYTIILILALPTALGLMQGPTGQMLFGISKHKSIAILGGIMAGVNLILSLIFVQFMGIKGVAIGTAIPSLLTSIFFYPVIACRSAGIAVRQYYIFMGTGLLRSVACAALAWLIFSPLISVNILNLVIAGTGMALVYTAAAFMVCFTKGEREYLINVMKSFFVAKKGNKSTNESR